MDEADSPQIRLVALARTRCVREICICDLAADIRGCTGGVRKLFLDSFPRIPNFRLSVAAVWTRQRGDQRRPNKSVTPEILSGERYRAQGLANACVQGIWIRFH
jgi:hypothetical protein